MLDPIDFLHDNNERQKKYLLDPSKVQRQILSILNKNKNKAKEWSDADHKRFALLNRLMWSISILDTIDNYSDYSENDISTFFVAFNTFYETIRLFNRIKVTKIFLKKTMAEEIFGGESMDEEKLVSFIRVLSFAHPSNVHNAGGSLKGGKIILVSINTYHTSPTNKELKTNPKAFYYNVLVSKNGTSESKIFKVYIDELKQFLKARYKSCNFKKLEKE